MQSPCIGKEVWFLTGGQDLYGEETPAQVPSQSQEIAKRLDQLPVSVGWGKPRWRSAWSSVSIDHALLGVAGAFGGLLSAGAEANEGPDGARNAVRLCADHQRRVLDTRPLGSPIGRPGIKACVGLAGT